MIMDPTRLQILVEVAYPAMLGAILIMLSMIGCRLHTHHQRLTNLETGPRVSVTPPSLDPMPPPHTTLTIPTIQTQAQARYSEYI